MRLLLSLPATLVTALTSLVREQPQGHAMLQALCGAGGMLVGAGVRSRVWRRVDMMLQGILKPSTQYISVLCLYCCSDSNTRLGCFATGMLFCSAEQAGREVRRPTALEVGRIELQSRT